MRYIYYNGVVDTIEFGFKEAFVVEDGKFLYVGDNGTAKKYSSNKNQLIDLKNTYVIGGFNDSHMHLLGYGNSLSQLDLSHHTSSLQELLNALKEYVEEKGYSGDWVKARGWNQDFFQDEVRFPNRYDLDQISKDVPLCITRACGHICVCNSKALEIAGIDKFFKQIDGGHFDVDENNEPLGIFRENACSLIYQMYPKPDVKIVKEMIKKACKSLNQYGITSSQTDDFTVFDLNYEIIIKAYLELMEEKALTVRVYEQSQLKNIEILKDYLSKGYHHLKVNEFFKLGPLKLLGDGSLGARTAFLNEPYSDDPTTSGILIYSKEELYELMKTAHTNGMQIAIHGIGDAMIDRIIDTFEEVLKEYPREDHRHGIIHLQIMNERQVERMKSLNLIGYIQSIFLDYDIKIVKDRVGKRADTSYCFKTLNDALINVSNGSDTPVEKPDIFKGLQCLITRKSIDGVGPYNEKEAFELKEGLDSFISKGAYASFEEKVKGNIKEGNLADFVLLSKNPYEEDLNDLYKNEVLETYLGGILVYKK